MLRFLPRFAIRERASHYDAAQRYLRHFTFADVTMPRLSNQSHSHICTSRCVYFTPADYYVTNTRHVAAFFADAIDELMMLMLTPLMRHIRRCFLYFADAA